MVKFKLIATEDNYYTYEVYPEGNTDDVGVITFNIKTLDIKEKKYPKAGGKYLNKAITGLKDENGNFKDSGMVAWY